MKTTLFNKKNILIYILCIALTTFCVCSLTAQSSASKQGTKKSDGTIEYTVQKGDTLYGIARKFDVSVADICTANNITKTEVLKAGKKLIIPIIAKPSDSKSADSKTTDKKASEQKSSDTQSDSSTKPKESGSDATDSDERKYDTYTVQKGDTFWHIAQINDITVDELKKMNNLSSETTLKVGQKLKIPATIVDTTKTTPTELPDLTSSDPRNYSDKKGDSTLVWPVKTSSVTYTKGKVGGVQLSASKNEAVTAIRAGTVMYCGNYRGYGQVVFVQSKTGHIYAYSGLGSIKVTKGQYVVFGDTLGTAGIDSYNGNSSMSLMVFLKGTTIDPAKAPRG